MTLLNQIVAVEKGVKSAAAGAFTAAYHQIQRTPQFSGLARTYRPKDEDGDQFPPESTLVQIKTPEVLENVKAALTRLFDVTLTKDTANCAAKADVVVDGQVIVQAAPITFLLFLEKQLVDLGTFVGKLPTLDPAEKWSYDANAGAYSTQPVETVRSKKVLRNHVKAAATDKHPAQVDTYNEDVVAGYWSTIKFSGALPADARRAILERCEKLTTAVKFAREKANTLTVTDLTAGDTVLSYLFG